MDLATQKERILTPTSYSQMEVYTLFTVELELYTLFYCDRKFACILQFQNNTLQKGQCLLQSFRVLDSEHKIYAQ